MHFTQSPRDADAGLTPHFGITEKEPLSVAKGIEGMRRTEKEIKTNQR